MKLLMLRGLPASGKSTYAKDLVAKQGYTRVNKDELRAMLHNGKWGKGNEVEVKAIRDSVIMHALANGKNVVVDDTNFHPDHEQQFRRIVSFLRETANDVTFEIKDFDTDVEECIKRDLARPNSVGEQVIRKMWREYVAPVKTYVPGEDYSIFDKQTVICDIDGTLTNGPFNRSPYDWGKVLQDQPNHRVIDLVHMLYSMGYEVMLFSGRDGSCRGLTEQWLRDWGVSYHSLHMRQEGDVRKDYVIKKEIYESVKGSKNIAYVIDDRAQVCRMWHEEGLTLLKVGDPDLEF